MPAVESCLYVVIHLPHLLIAHNLSVETHAFWQHAVAVYDPQDALGHLAYPQVQHKNSSTGPASLRLTPFRHFRSITNYSCSVCRINHPGHTLLGLGQAKRLVPTYLLNFCGVCKEHERRRPMYCGICLRDSPGYEVESFTGIACMDNEDEETFPNVDATCRSCRKEWLFAKVKYSPLDREAVGLDPKRLEFCPSDYEARAAVEAYVNLAEGTIPELLTIAQERLWLKKHTKLGDMLQQAVASRRYEGREQYGRGGGGGYAIGTLSAMESYEDEELEMMSDLEDELDDDIEILHMTESDGVRDLALGDWARTRILGGLWLSPADQWYHLVPCGPDRIPLHPPRAEHPAPWTIEEAELDSSDPSAEPVVHPTRSLLEITGVVPPTFSLCEQAFSAHRKAMRDILLPAMKNIVRRLVIECGADRLDPALKANRMSVEEVLTQLRDEAVWFDGVDWLERRRNVERERALERERKSRRLSSDGSSTSSSSKSDASESAASPTTLQTTPSPPPVKDKDEHVSSVEARPVYKPVTIAVSPVLDPPRPLRHIPFIPSGEAILDMPNSTMESFKMVRAYLPLSASFSHGLIGFFLQVWREACAPLYHCRCTICERANTKVNEANGNAHPLTSGTTVVSPTVESHPPPRHNPGIRIRDDPPHRTTHTARGETPDVDLVITPSLHEDDDSPVVEIKLDGPEDFQHYQPSDEDKHFVHDLGDYEYDDEEEDDDDDAYLSDELYSLQDKQRRERSLSPEVDDVDRPGDKGRKRSVDELDERKEREVTPPKRARHEHRQHEDDTRHRYAEEPRNAKRSSEELDGEEGVRLVPIHQKRAKTSSSTASPPASITTAGGDASSEHSE